MPEASGEGPALATAVGFCQFQGSSLGAAVWNAIALMMGTDDVSAKRSATTGRLATSVNLWCLANLIAFTYGLKRAVKLRSRVSGAPKAQGLRARLSP